MTIEEVKKQREAEAKKDAAFKRSLLLAASLATTIPLSGLNIGPLDKLNQTILSKTEGLKNKAVSTIDSLASKLGITGIETGNPTLPDLCPNQNILDEVYNIRQSLGNDIENISSYVSYQENSYTEIEFLNELCKRTGCGILLDINNIFVSAFNHGYDPWHEIKKVNPHYVNQYHIAGHSQIEDYLFDTHDKFACKEVWDLMHWALINIGKKPVIIERDDADVKFEDLIFEINYGNNFR
jgi:uncharacterized protein (UPF0276 family)